MARVQSYSGKPFQKRKADLGTGTVEVTIPQPSRKSQEGNGKSIRVMLRAVTNDIQVNFVDGDFATDYFTVKATDTMPTVFDVEVGSFWIKGTNASCGYECLVEVSHG